ncbi:MAG: polysaccharide biosynthesis/export family protein [Pseudomonadota bacterium]
MSQPGLLTIVRHAALATVITVMAATAALADAYRLVAGDRLSLRIAAQGISEDLMVDVDGQIRLVDVGGLTVQGLTLDEAEDRIEDVISDAGLYVDLQVTLSILEHAPLVVIGDVTRSGSVDYIPGMIVASALAMSGGSQVQGVSRLEIERARNEVEGQVKILNLEIATTVISIARIEAGMREEAEFDISPEMLAAIPNRPAIEMDVLLDAEKTLLRTNREEADYLLAFWEREIATIEENQRLFAERISLQEDIINRTSDNLRDAQALQERGLQTATRLNAAEQRAADAQARVLELESARIAAAQALSDAQRERARYIANTQANLLEALQGARVQLETLTLRYAKAVEHLAILSEGQISSLLIDGPVTLQFQLRSQREGRASVDNVTAETPLLPGDTLFVTVDLSGEDSLN